MSIHRHRYFRYSVICIKLYRLTAQTVHLLIVVVRIDRTRNMRDEKLILERAEPSRRLRYCDYISSILHQSSWKAACETELLFG